MVLKHGVYSTSVVVLLTQHPLKSVTTVAATMKRGGIGLSKEQPGLAEAALSNPTGTRTQ